MRLADANLGGVHSEKNGLQLAEDLAEKAPYCQFTALSSEWLGLSPGIISIYINQYFNVSSVCLSVCLCNGCGHTRDCARIRKKIVMTLMST